MNKEILLSNIQRFSIHDGPGIRTTVFLKGCSLRCPWCSNPENQIPMIQDYVRDGIHDKYGQYYTSDELVTECLKDKLFYEGVLNSTTLWNINESSQIELLPGGVTFSGGEPLLQMPALQPVCEALHKTKTHIAIETCLFCSPDNLEKAIRHIDLFYVDIKILNIDLCKEVEKGDLLLYLKNFNTLMKSNKPVVVRIPVIGKNTDDIQNRLAVHDLLLKSVENGGKILKIELIKEHKLGETKYRSLGLTMNYHGIDDGLLVKYKSELADLNILTDICVV